MQNRLVLLCIMLLGIACAPYNNEPKPPPRFQAVTFEDDFAFGTATAGWQIEGDEGRNGPIESNWRRFLAMGKAKAQQQNNNGNGFYQNYADDIARARDLSLTQFRLSIDWSRIVPSPGVIDQVELDHVSDVLDAIVAAGLEPVVTLYHWTVPVWVQNPDADFGAGKVDKIASADRAVVDDFAFFVRAVIPVIKDRVDMYTVLNEPLTMVVAGYLNGTFPPGEFFNIPLATRFGINLAFMHAKAYDIIKELDNVDANGDGDDSFVGLTMTANEIYPERADSAQEQLAAESLNYVYNDWFIHALTTGALDVDLNGEIDEEAVTDPREGTYPELAGRLEFIGVQYYGPVYVKEVGFLSQTAPLYGLPLLDVADYTNTEAQKRPHNGMGREIKAAGFRDTLRRYGAWGLPLYVTENGTTTNVRAEVADDATTLPAPQFDDAQAAMYLLTHLWEVGRAKAEGIDVRGYFHWTLADNFEWVEGTLQRFGAYRVDFGDDALPRTLTPMGEALRAVIAARGIDEALWQTFVLDRFGSDATSAGEGVTSSEPVIQ